MDETLIIKQVAEILGIGTSGVRMLIYNNRLPATKRGRDWLIRKSDLDAYQEQRRKPGRPSHKTCTKCGEEKPLEEFAAHERGLWGRRADCLACHRIYNREYIQDPIKRKERLEAKRERRRKNNDAVVEQRRRYYEADKDYYRKKHREWLGKNKDYQREHYREWSKTPAGNAAIRRGSHARRVRLLEVQNDLTTEQIADLMQRATRCAYCKRPFTKARIRTLDHVIPLAKGGPHTLSNIVIACKPCNCSKHDSVIHLL